jgi:glycerophosphoryl diester phosphodiesterase
MELIAHRAGNRCRTIAPALAAADGAELDVHRFRDRLEVRHSKVLWPFAVYWDRGQGLSSDADPPELHSILAAAPTGGHLWIDLKGFTPRLTARVLRELGDRRPVTMSCRSWWALGPARRATEVRTFRSIGNRWQLWLALRCRHPDGVGLHERLARPEHLERLRGRCSGIAVWAVRDRERAIALREQGVAVLIIDDLALIRSIRDVDD